MNMFRILLVSACLLATGLGAPTEQEADDLVDKESDQPLSLSLDVGKRGVGDDMNNYPVRTGNYADVSNMPSRGSSNNRSPNLRRNKRFLRRFYKKARGAWKNVRRIYSGFRKLRGQGRQTSQNQQENYPRSRQRASPSSSNERSRQRASPSRGNERNKDGRQRMRWRY